jgi:hypothetical protein
MSGRRGSPARPMRAAGPTRRHLDLPPSSGAASRTPAQPHGRPLVGGRHARSGPLERTSSADAVPSVSIFGPRDHRHSRSRRPQHLPSTPPHRIPAPKRAPLITTHLPAVARAAPSTPDPPPAVARAGPAAADSPPAVILHARPATSRPPPGTRNDPLSDDRPSYRRPARPVATASPRAVPRATSGGDDPPSCGPPPSPVGRDHASYRRPHGPRRPPPDLLPASANGPSASDDPPGGVFSALAPHRPAARRPSERNLNPPPPQMEKNLNPPGAPSLATSCFFSRT